MVAPLGEPPGVPGRHRISVDNDYVPRFGYLCAMVTPDRKWETARIRAEATNASDKQVLFDTYTTDSAVAKYMTWKPHRSVAETSAFAARCEQAWADDT